MEASGSPGRPTMKLFRQNQLAQARGLQLVGTAVVVDLNCFLATQNVVAAHAGLCSVRPGGQGERALGSWLLHA